MILVHTLIAGILTSLLHVISGPDHLAAVTPLVIETKRKAWKVGLAWGLGHLIGMLVIGGVFIVFKEFIPVEAISEHSEQLVALVLIGVGFWSLFRIFKEQNKHLHPHIHTDNDSYIHTHEHQHNHSASHQHTHQAVIKQNLFTSFSIGILHGLAGVSHFILLLPVLGFTNTFESGLYIVGFAIGTVLAMTSYALVLAKITQHSKQQHNEILFKGIRLSGGLFALIIGFYWLFLTF